jgi:hypothetical protein
MTYAFRASPVVHGTKTAAARCHLRRSRRRWLSAVAIVACPAPVVGCLVAREQGSTRDIHGRDAEAGGPNLPCGTWTHPRKDQQ